MTIDPTEAARIAKGLTKAQRAALEYLAKRQHHAFFPSKGSFSATAAKSLHRKGLANGISMFSVSDLGLAVAQALKAERGA